MSRLVSRIVLAVGLLVLAAGQGPAQSCARQDVRAVRLLDQVRTIVSIESDPWPTVRGSLGLPLMSADSVAVVTDTTICARAASAYDREVQRRDGSAPKNRKIHLVRIGHFFAANDPDDRVDGSEWSSVMLFTNDFVYLRAWTK